ncbi:MAG: ATP-binding protein [Candidatus Nanopelagicales bacterium]
MDRVSNPYTPNAGARPPELAGRAVQLDEFDTVLQRVQLGLTDKGVIITGLRGVGKTVLLNAFEDLAVARNLVVVKHEASKQVDGFARKFPSLARRALLELSPADRWKTRARRAAGVLRGFKAQFDPQGRWTITFDGADVEGVADTGDFTADLPELVVALGEAAQEHGQVLVFLIDEIQYLGPGELSALVMAKHQVNQRELPVVFAGAGLPQLPALTGQAQTYAERMFAWPEIGRLPAEAARAALVVPARAAGCAFDPDALDFIIDYTEGYPFFLQEFGKAVWNLAPTSPITPTDAQAARGVVDAVLDQDFFSLRVGALPERELDYLRALASLGPGEHTPADIARAMRVKSSASIGSFSRRLTERGLIYNSKRGRVAFTVPQFDRYVTRAL